MSIFLRTYGADSNPAGANLFCAFARPPGLTNGDVAIVAVAVPAGIIVTPPDSSWTQVAQTDPTLFGIVAFWKMCLNEPANWAFVLSASATVTGTCLVYANTDPFTPVEVSAATLTSSSATHQVGSVMASQVGEDLALFIAGAGSGTYTPAGNFQVVARKQQASATMEAQHKGLAAAGSQAAFTETFSSSVAGASLLLVIAPSYGLLSVKDVYKRLFEALPDGTDDFLDFTEGSGDFWKYLTVIAATVKLFAFDLVDLVRAEISNRLRYKLPDWERIFGLQTTYVSQFGTIPQRQAQFLGAWRAAAGQGAAIPTVQSVLAPLLGYNPGTTPVIYESDRPSLTLEHSYAWNASADTPLPAVTTTTMKMNVSDDGGVIAQMGAQLQLAFALSDLTGYTFVLTGPDGRSKTWSSTWSTVPLFLYAPEFAGARLAGTWTLAITNPTIFANTLYSASILFVEGTARGQQTAGAIFEWGVYADPAHLGEVGTPADFATARRMIQRLNFEHCVANLLQSVLPYPDTDSGVHAAIPDECIPT
jgi:hypothetical protein